MWRMTAAALAIITLSACSKRDTPPVAAVPAAELTATPLDDLVATIIDDEAQSARLCLAGKASACRDRDYAIRSLNERGYCQDAADGRWSKCPTPSRTK